MPPGFTRREFLEALFEEYFSQHDGFIMVKVVKVLDHKVSVRYFPSVDVLARQEYQDNQNVYFGVCPRESMKPRPDNQYRLPALWAALDFSAESHSGRASYFKLLSRAALAVRRFPYPPSIIVESGHGDDGAQGRTREAQCGVLRRDTAPPVGWAKAAKAP